MQFSELFIYAEYILNLSVKPNLHEEPLVLPRFWN